jgi:N utilization substance protein B
MGSRRKARILAMQALFSWEMTGCDTEDLLAFDWEPDLASESDAATFARLLVAGTIEQIGDVDAQIREHLEHWELERIASVDRAILRLGTYSLLYQTDVPPSVTIDEAVSIARAFGSDESYRFVNGVLDAIHRGQRG